MDAMHAAAAGDGAGAGMEPYLSVPAEKYQRQSGECPDMPEAGLRMAYNILIMEEMTDIIALEAQARSTKLVYHAENRVEQVENCKSVDDYINRFDEMLDRKREAF